MSEHDQLQPILQQLLQVHGASFQLGEHEVAFHALAAAAHAAERLDDMETLGRVAALSREELEWMDANQPHHRLSTLSAGERHHRSMFEQLASTATTMQRRIHTDHLRQAAAVALEVIRA
ncbi:hypothetical protein [Longimicrobium sp.]|uniref:hypothetical protein n=1 Tax=Longimicrobium sp. TaxID=2029185 RepID=UPI002C0ECC76|nr:hypothetical protein [Longimicrobium sp.]HSU17471.1 hypothetical protein [Longimicrobium sp.]